MNIVILSGPTATGKTDLALSLGKKVEFHLMNFDSLNFYKELKICTARPDEKSLEGISHSFFGEHSIRDPLSAADFMRDALKVLDDLAKKEKNVLLCGGSGFYLRALLKGMYPSIQTPRDILEKSHALYEKEGISPFWDLLKDKDLPTYQALHSNDHYRIRRAVEHFWSTGVPFSKAKKNWEKIESPLPKNWKLHHFHVDMEKQKHWSLIESRCQRMIDQGAILEIKNLLEEGYDPALRPLRSIGPKEIQLYLQGEIKTIEDLIEQMTISTRQLAKAQRTWFQKIEDKSTYHALKERDLVEESMMSALKLSS